MKLPEMQLTFGEYRFHDQGLDCQVSWYVVLAEFLNGCGQVFLSFASVKEFLQAFQTPAVFFDHLLDHPLMNQEGMVYGQQDYFDDRLGTLNNARIAGEWPWDNPCLIPKDDVWHVRVLNSAGLSSEARWSVTTGITDWQGRLSGESHEAVLALQNHPEVLRQLQGRIIPGMGRVARKNGRYGILYERAFLTRPCDGEDGPSPWTVRAGLYEAMTLLGNAHPYLDVCVVEDASGRPAIWVFAGVDELFHEQWQALMKTLQQLGSERGWTAVDFTKDALKQ